MKVKKKKHRYCNMLLLERHKRDIEYKKNKSSKKVNTCYNAASPKEIFFVALAVQITDAL